MINVAIVGTGSISNLHTQAYLKFPERCKIVALCDIVPGKAEAYKEKYSLDADIYLDHKDLLGRGDIHLVDVCTPPYVHAEISINSLMSGKNVVCEKPMAASLEECDAMIAARDKSGMKLSIIAQNRFRTPIRDLKALLDSGIAGPVKHAQINSFWWRGTCYYDLWWRGKWETEGGGCTLNHAVHHIDMLGWMMGLPQSVVAMLANDTHTNAEVEDLSVAVMRYDGALAQVTSSVVHHGEEQQVVFQCEKAKVAAPFECYASTSMANGFPVRNDALETEIKAYTESLPEMKYEVHTGQLENVLTAIETDTKPAIGGEDGRLTIELITSIYKAGSTNSKVDLPLQKDDAFYTVAGIMANTPKFYEKKVSADNLDGEITTGSDYKK